ncbi:interleukin-10 receptor subunit alpha isoform X2 [Cuculus canorus]|uniref:interleukin-10 receptor subunit alpha isoform X2 n=1 Tax=Cuculus canorus TaxID=55661 RepID=UPI0023AA98D2|nr:interleukin-10 receptor subunit alpha isoform X2 [Cuculus canorus]
MAPCATALALCVALLLARLTDGETLASPKHVRFDAKIAHHVLRWEPGNNPPSDVRYEVEHKVYGTNISWTAIPSCMKIPGHSCDLTYYTLDSTLRYYARVRAVSGNHTSPWQRSSSFSPREASLLLPGQNLSVIGNTICVQLQLLLRVGNLTVKYDDIQRHVRRYLVYVRVEQDNRTYQVVKSVPEFNISNLFWDTKYCVSVEPCVASRPNRAVRTDEQCVTIGKRDRSSELVVSIVSSSFITVFLLGLLGVLLVCTYIKKPMRPPSVLTFIKQSSLWMEESSSSPGSLDGDPDPVQQLFLCQKEPQQDSGSNSSTGTAQLPLEKDWRLPVWTVDRWCLMGLETTGSRDSSCTSTDSGICLRASSTELSCSLVPEPQGYKRQLPTSNDRNLGLENICPHPQCSSGTGTTSLVEAGLQLSVSPAASQDSQQDVEFHGYLRQSKSTVEPRQEPAKEMSLSRTGSLRGPVSSTGVALDVECSELAVSKGYLKQSSEHPCSHAQDLTPWGSPQEPTAWHFSGQVGPQAPTLLPCGVPDAPLASKAGPELLKAPFDLSIFNTDILGTLPLISSLSTNEWLTLQINPLSLLNGDSKDSRL